MIELDTITAMNAGRGPGGGGALLPGSVLQGVPQLGVGGLRAKPLKAAGASPPVKEFSFHHCAPQNSIEVPFRLLLSPMTNEPPPGANANTSTVQEVLAVLPPSSLIEVVTVKRPVVP